MKTYISIDLVDLNATAETGNVKVKRNKIICQKDTVSILTLERNAKHYGKKYIQKWAEKFGGLNGCYVKAQVICGKTICFDFMKVFYNEGGVSRWMRQSVLC